MVARHEREAPHGPRQVEDPHGRHVDGRGVADDHAVAAVVEAFVADAAPARRREHSQKGREVSSVARRGAELQFQKIPWSANKCWRLVEEHI